MLDENLPTFFIKPASDNPRQSTVLLGQGGHDLQPEYTIRRPDPNLPASQNCYAVALYDSYNPDVLYAEVLVQPEWTQPTLSQAEIRANNGATPPPVPIVPNSFTIQLYNPDQQVIIRQIAGSWNSSAYWEFEMPEHTFRMPSTSALDRIQSDPAASEVTPKVSFKWRREGKLSKDITCYLAGRSTDGKKSKEPDITVAMFRHGKELTIYQPNMHRVEVEDLKGLEVVMILGAAVIKDIFFNPSRDMFNISSPSTSRKNSSGIAIANSRTNTTPPSGPVASGALPAPSPPNAFLASQIPPAKPQRPPQAEVDAETTRLLAQLELEEKERERRERKQEKRTKKMLEQEERERQRREEEVAKETERLRRQYGVEPVLDDAPPFRPQVHFTPPLPQRPNSRPHSPNANYNQGPSPMPQYLSAPHSRPSPVIRPSSTPAQSGPVGPFHTSTLNAWWAGSSASATAPQKHSGRHRHGHSGSSPYIQAPGGQGNASSSGFFGGSHRDRDERRVLLGRPAEGEKKKVTKKRSVYF